MPGTGTSEADLTRNSPEAVAERAAVAARESAIWLREESARLVANYKKQSRYYKWRSYIIASYAVVAVGSILVAMPPLNGIKAHVRVTSDDLDGRPLIYVQNDAKDDWTDVRLIVNKEWTFEQERLPSGSSITVKLENFRHLGSIGADARPKSDLVPKHIKIKCRQGSFEQWLP
jgi:hypothetical protein